MRVARHASTAAVVVACLFRWPVLAKPDPKSRPAGNAPRNCPEPYVMDPTGVSISPPRANGFKLCHVLLKPREVENVAPPINFHYVEMLVGICSLCFFNRSAFTAGKVHHDSRNAAVEGMP